MLISALDRYCPAVLCASELCPANVRLPSAAVRTVDELLREFITNTYLLVINSSKKPKKRPWPSRIRASIH